MERQEKPTLIGDVMERLSMQPEFDGESGEFNIMSVFKHEEIGD